jgi:membrane-bound metal-dependent hydrolase YbcI (DUF457 family)
MEEYLYYKLLYVYMYPRGHAGVALILNVPFLIYFVDHLVISLLCTLIIMWSSISPDIDISNKSFLNRLDHRSMTHTLEFAIFISIIFNILILLIILSFNLNGIISYVYISVFLGLSSHIIADILDTHGVKLSYILPKKRYKLSVIKDNSSKILNNSLFAFGTILNFIVILQTV